MPNFGTYRYTVVKDKDGRFHHKGARTKKESARSFESKAELTNHVRAMCAELNLNAEEVDGKVKDKDKVKSGKASRPAKQGR